ncbi:YkvA family protein [Terrabacter sp. C0L_2]|uniref:YkvA family protein n=1 Tax=Terrabacter sp. C0L_2 TaxID=3108389 RepID=UPI002ED3E4F1|nr:YkvA family protein [Terrabacter sp. C0L_2]
MKTASRIKMAATVASVVRAATRPGGPSLPERVQAVPRLVRCTLDRTYAGTTLKRLGLVAGAVAYVASPVDLVPEAFLPVVGAADDAVVITWAVRAFFEETDRFLAWEAGRGASGARPSANRGGRSTWTSAPPNAARSTGTAPVAPLGAPAGGSDGSLGVVRPDGQDAHLHRDRDATGAAAPRRLPGLSRVRAGGARPGGEEGLRLPEGTRQAATDYVLESVRKRLER